MKPHPNDVNLNFNQNVDLFNESDRRRRIHLQDDVVIVSTIFDIVL